MEVAVNCNVLDSTSTTPFTTAPSSPTIPGAAFQQLHRYYTSAPTSPSRAAALYRHFRSATAVTMTTSSASTPSSPAAVIPFDWEETPGTPKSPRDEEKQQLLNVHHDEDDDDDYSVDDFAFEFSGQLVHDAPAYTATADELFEAGKIRPLKPPPRLYVAAGEHDAFVPGSATAPTMSPRSPKSPTSAARTFFMPSPRWRRPGRWQSTEAGDVFVDPFEVAMQEATRGRDPGTPPAEGGERARARRRPSRSLSPLRGLFDFGGGKSGGDSSTHKTSTPPAVSTNTPASPASSNGGLAKGSSGSKKWRLRDLFLFRSASEGRATGDRSKDPLRKYTAASGLLSAADTARGSSFRSTVSRTRDGSVAGDTSRRSTGGDGSVGGSSRRGTGSDGSVGRSSRRSVAGGGGVVPPSPHEVHYAANRAVSEELRKKTFLPYRQGLLGCLGFSPAGAGASLARGLSSVGVGATVSSRRF